MAERDYATATGFDVRLAAREGKHTGPTAGLAPGFLQANLLVLPAEYADDFRRLCARNPVPCPLIGESSGPGVFDRVTGIPSRLSMTEAGRLDLRTDAPAYMVYSDGRLVRSHCGDVRAEWTAGHVGFLIGCSYSFEAALAGAGLEPRHVAQGRNVAMYRTTLPVLPAGVFGATAATETAMGGMVVSMRVYRRREVEAVRRVTAGFGATHGEPLAWGWEALGRLGIRDVDEPDWGDAPLTEDGMPLGKGRRRREQQDEGGEEEEVPVFWGCGVTPQEAVMRAGLKGVVMAHAPGHMLVLDAKDEDIVG